MFLIQVKSYLFGDHLPKVFNRIRKWSLSRYIFLVLYLVEMGVVMFDITGIYVPSVLYKYRGKS